MLAFECPLANLQGFWSPQCEDRSLIELIPNQNQRKEKMAAQSWILNQRNRYSESAKDACASWSHTMCAFVKFTDGHGYSQSATWRRHEQVFSPPERNLTGRKPVAEWMTYCSNTVKGRRGETYQSFALLFAPMGTGSRLNTTKSLRSIYFTDWGGGTQVKKIMPCLSAE
jgi:hypothetical protein